MSVLSLRLALREIGHWRMSAICQVFLVAGVIAPILLLQSIQSGMIRDLRAYFESSPDNLRLFPTESFSRDEAWFDRWSKDERVGFLAPHPYENAVELSFKTDAHPQPVDAVILASGEGDLMLPPDTPPPAPTETVLTVTLAEALGVGVGDRVQLVGFRPPETHSDWAMTVTAITPRSRWSAEGALVNADVVEQAWLWRMGHSSRLFGLLGEPPPEQVSYPRFRMYAKNLSDLQPLADRLRAEGVDVTANFGDAELADAIESSARTIVIVVSLAAIIGAVAALVAAFRADAERLRPSLRLLQMDGMSRGQARAMLVWKALLVSGAGWLLGAGLFFGGLMAANAGIRAANLPFVASGEIAWAAIAGFAAAALAVAALAGLAAAELALRGKNVEGRAHG